MRFLHSLLVLSFLSFPAFAQELFEVPATDAAPTDTPILTVDASETMATGEKSSSIFDSMMETLFGKSSLPEPQGTLRGSTTDPLQPFAEAPVPPAGYVEAPMAPMGPDNFEMSPPMMDAPFPPVQPIFDAPLQAAPPRNRVANFDISGIKLKMTPREVFKAARAQGFELNYMDKTSANFVKWRLERECMDEGVFIYERKQECIKENAKKAGDYYINFMEFVKKDTREKIRTFFTSSFSGNKLYRITYYNEGDNSLGESPASQYIKDKRRTEFFNWLTKKYGNPDDPQSMVWGEGGDSPYFQAYVSGSSVNFHLTLENPMMPYDDSQVMRNADVKGVTYSKFSF